jgi:hypothetical protein
VLDRGEKRELDRLVRDDRDVGRRLRRREGFEQ